MLQIFRLFFNKKLKCAQEHGFSGFKKFEWVLSKIKAEFFFLFKITFQLNSLKIHGIELHSIDFWQKSAEQSQR